MKTELLPEDTDWTDYRNYSATPEPLLSSPSERGEKKGQQHSLRTQPAAQMRLRERVTSVWPDTLRTSQTCTLTAQEILFHVFYVFLAFVPGPVMHSKLRGELGKYCTKEKVPGELLTNTEQSEQSKQGRRERRHTHMHTHTHTHKDRSKRPRCMPTLFTQLAFSSKHHISLCSHKPLQPKPHSPPS